jgi:hypothetical protein
MAGVTYPTFAAGQKLTAALLNAAIPSVAYKASDQSVTNSTTVVNDNDLSFSVVSGATYNIDSYLQWVGNDTGDIKFGFTFPASSTLSFAIIGPDDTATTFASGGTRGTGEWFARNGQTSSPSGTIQVSGSTSTLAGIIKGQLVCNTTGTLQLQWAQNTANATATTLKAGSWMSLKRVA